MNLATAYCKRIEGSRKDNLEEAIKLHMAVLTVYTKHANPVCCAAHKLLLLEPFATKPKDNLEEAVKLYMAVLTVYTRDPITLMNLAIAYSARIAQHMRTVYEDNGAVLLLHEVCTIMKHGYDCFLLAARNQLLLPSRYRWGLVPHQAEAGRVCWRVAVYLAQHRAVFSVSGVGSKVESAADAGGGC